jgi:hypothetical protein
VLYLNFKELRLPKSAAASGAAYVLPFEQKFLTSLSPLQIVRKIRVPLGIGAVLILISKIGAL